MVDAKDFLATLPSRFQDVPWVGERFPSAPGVTGVEAGANCQLYAYEVLRHMGWEIPPLRSSDLWEDETATAPVDGDPEAFDLMLFAPTEDPYGAHVGLFLGDGYVLHLCAEVGRPAVWRLEEFRARPRYRHVRVKRPIRRTS